MNELEVYYTSIRKKLISNFTMNRDIKNKETRVVTYNCRYSIAWVLIPIVQ